MTTLGMLLVKVSKPFDSSSFIHFFGATSNSTRIESEPSPRIR
jgi:hypothetical protein